MSASDDLHVPSRMRTGDMLLSPTGSTTYPLLNGIDRGTAIRCVATVLRHARSEEEARMFLAMLIDPGGVIG